MQCYNMLWIVCLTSSMSFCAMDSPMVVLLSSTSGYSKAVSSKHPKNKVAELKASVVMPEM